jgi:hypothetical protein
MAGKGGVRPGAGRKPNRIKPIADKITRTSAELILSAINERGVWLELVKDDDARIRLDAMKYLTDRRDGKPKQSLEHTGEGGGPLCLAVKFV